MHIINSLQSLGLEKDAKTSFLSILLSVVLVEGIVVCPKEANLI